MKLLVGMLSHGEHERERAIAALKKQSYRNWDFFEIAGKPNKDAHQELYATFMSSGADCYLKLDADMVFKADVLEFLVGQTGSSDWLMVNVDDWPSSMNIPGMQIFSNRCKWQDDGDRLIVDVAPTHQTIRYFRNQRWVDHMPDPSDYQCFRYGVHRALKVMQPDREVKDPQRASLHYSILKNTWKVRAKDSRRNLVIIGAECVFSGRHQALLRDYAGTFSRKVFEDVKA